MREFEPSPEFVSRVMERVHAYEASMRRARRAASRLYRSRSFRIAVTAGGLLVAAANMVRLYLMFFAPLACG
jgi:ABC-type uncharacterized transport system permease subunit